MSRTVTLALAALALVAVSACDELTQRVVAQQGPSALAQDDAPAEGTEGGDCYTCGKFRARPPAGINVPPSL